MGFFDLFRKKEERTSGEVEVDSGLLAAILNQDSITPEEAMCIPAVAGCVQLICGALSTIPVRLYRTKGDATEEVKDDYRLKLVNSETGDVLDAPQWRAAIVRDYLLLGHGYTYVERKGNRITGLYYIKPENVSYTESTDPIYKQATFAVNGKSYRDYEIARILRRTRNGIYGFGIVRENSKLLNVMRAALSYEFRTFKTGSKRGFIKAQEKLTQDSINALKEGWRNLYSSDSEESVVILNRGLDFQDASQNAVDSQLQSIAAQNSAEICKLFGISPKLLEGGANDDDVKLSVRYGIAPVASAINAMLNRFLLLEKEKGEYEFELDLDALDATDMLTRYQAYQIAIEKGWLSIDDVRNAEGFNRLGFDYIKLGLEAVLYDPENKTVYTANTGSTVSLDDMKKGVITAGKEVQENGNQDQ